MDPGSNRAMTKNNANTITKRVIQVIIRAGIQINSGPTIEKIITKLYYKLLFCGESQPERFLLKNSKVRHECPTTTKGPSSSAQTEYRVQHYAMDAMDDSFKLLLKISRYNSFLCASCKRKYSSAKLLRQRLEKDDRIILLLFKSNLQQNRNDKTSLR